MNTGEPLERDLPRRKSLWDIIGYYFSVRMQHRYRPIHGYVNCIMVLVILRLLLLVALYLNYIVIVVLCFR